MVDALRADLVRSLLEVERLKEQVNASLQESVSFTVTVAGDVVTFDESAYKAALAALLDGVDPSTVTLKVVPASVSVTATFTAANNTAAANTLIALSDDLDALGRALGVSVESVTPPSIAPPCALTARPFLVEEGGAGDGLSNVAVALLASGATAVGTLALQMLAFVAYSSYKKQPPVLAV